MESLLGLSFWFQGSTSYWLGERLLFLVGRSRRSLGWQRFWLGCFGWGTTLNIYNQALKRCLDELTTNQIIRVVGVVQCHFLRETDLDWDLFLVSTKVEAFLTSHSRLAPALTPVVSGSSVRFWPCSTVAAALHFWFGMTLRGSRQEPSWTCCRFVQCSAALTGQCECSHCSVNCAHRCPLSTVEWCVVRVGIGGWRGPFLFGKKRGRERHELARKNHQRPFRM
jgi:hypothetical protein